jgi:hypothetical protein
MTLSYLIFLNIYFIFLFHKVLVPILSEASVDLVNKDLVGSVNKDLVV